MNIKGIENMDYRSIESQVQQGGRFVIYTYCISIILMTFRRSSDIYFIRADGNAVTAGLKFTLLSAIVGWWGIPWGPIYTIGALITNLRGGKDVTAEVMASITEQSA
ncbi:hypothetical protein [Paenibacillus sp. MMS20-IR301]|uniref:hypothetical protein n=1 Tax=Paenibacillus sp. MMS20-IR301 TaxID=2895946 RepID=UPI0028F0CE45|nr:hypothetical protein [Paenibacillus sp. MMS20-IR301]WNS45603.1 hypothetical protein LOS79_10130 [Paenibacillus sp. MMS20-IR301]